MNPLKPSPELVLIWWKAAIARDDVIVHVVNEIATKAAEWGAQQVSGDAKPVAWMIGYDFYHDEYLASLNGKPTPLYTSAQQRGVVVPEQSSEIERLQAAGRLDLQAACAVHNAAFLEQQAEIEILRQKVAELEKQVPRWIPVSERLPDFGNDALWLNKRGRCIVFEIDTDVEELSPDSPYWMPLPTTPQEVKE